MNLRKKMEYYATHSPTADLIAITLIFGAIGAPAYLEGTLSGAIPGVAVLLAYIWGKVNGRYYSTEVSE